MVSVLLHQGNVWLTDSSHHLRHLLGQHVCQDVDGVRLGFGSRSSCEQDLQQSDLTQRERERDQL